MRHASGPSDITIRRKGQDLHVPHAEPQWLEEEVHAKANQ